MRIKNFLIAISLTIASVVMSGCSMFGGLKNIELEDVAIKNISVVDGITVDVKGTECTFSFTAERDKIFEEIKYCLIDHAFANAGAVPIPVGFTSAVVKEKPIDPELIREAEKATIEIMKQIPAE